MDCNRASDAERVCEPADGDQCPKDRKPIFFIVASTQPGAGCIPRGSAPDRPAVEPGPAAPEPARGQTAAPPCGRPDPRPGRPIRPYRDKSPQARRSPGKVLADLPGDPDRFRTASASAQEGRGD